MQKKALVVITENKWLYLGIDNLLPDINCYHHKFNDQNISTELLNYEHIFIAVDSLILIQGLWTALHKIQALKNNLTVIWLTKQVSGRVFPFDSLDDLIIPQKINTSRLKERLREILFTHPLPHSVERVTPLYLTYTERLLLPYFIAGISFDEISRLTGYAIKSLYTHRQRITNKAGFKNQAYLFFVFQSNLGVIGLFSPESVGG